MAAFWAAMLFANLLGIAYYPGSDWLVFQCAGATASTWLMTQHAP